MILENILIVIQSVWRGPIRRVFLPNIVAILLTAKYAKNSDEVFILSYTATALTLGVLVATWDTALGRDESWYRGE